FVTTDVARAVVDMNRAEDDFGKDGVVKTHTCWDVEVWRTPPPDELKRALLSRYHRPYHERLRRPPRGVRLGVDCHTMAAHGPPVGPDPGVERPWICLSHGDGTCPDAWLDELAACFERSFGTPPSINTPFRGGYIVRTYAAMLPWVQVELSRAPFLSLEEKRGRVLDALEQWCRQPLS
ncbi:MAG: N-formylglutamate amidohydrolase, partial [Planctomycetota bacterium]